MKKISNLLKSDVVDVGLCIGCGLCCALDQNHSTKLERDRKGELKAKFGSDSELSEAAWLACPGKGVDYPTLFHFQFGGLPTDWRIGHAKNVWTGHATDMNLRNNSSSGGVSTAVLQYLLDNELVDGVIVAKQGTDQSLLEAGWILVEDSSELSSFAESVYVTVPMLDSLRYLDPSKKYAITVTPELCSALRELQRVGHKAALSIKYILGPYTGTALEQRAIQGMFKIYGVKNDDKLISLKWRTGSWPGYFEAGFGSGFSIRAKKVYYNFLIPFYVSKCSLTSMDFANDFTDLSVGDAWSPKFEGKSLGHSVVVCRTEKMGSVISDMLEKKILTLQKIDPLEASNMHGHMIDFKRRGSFIRRVFFRLLGQKMPDNGLYVRNLPLVRVFAEVPIFVIFLLCRTNTARFFMRLMPPNFLGYLFNLSRLVWKYFSKPIKRKGLKFLDLHGRTPRWKNKL